MRDLLALLVQELTVGVQIAGEGLDLLRELADEVDEELVFLRRQVAHVEQGEVGHRIVVLALVREVLSQAERQRDEDATGDLALLVDLAIFEDRLPVLQGFGKTVEGRGPDAVLHDVVLSQLRPDEAVAAEIGRAEVLVADSTLGPASILGQVLALLERLQHSIDLLGRNPGDQVLVVLGAVLLGPEEDLL